MLDSPSVASERFPRRRSPKIEVTHAFLACTGLKSNLDRRILSTQQIQPHPSQHGWVQIHLQAEHDCLGSVAVIFVGTWARR